MAKLESVLPVPGEARRLVLFKKKKKLLLLSFFLKSIGNLGSIIMFLL